MTAHDLPQEAILNGMLSGSYKDAQAIYVSAKLGVADLLTDGPRSSIELARMTGTHAPSLDRLLRLLASKGVFAEVEQGYFALTPAATLLQTDVPGSLRPAALFVGELEYPSWGGLLYSVTTGRPAFDHIHGQSLFTYLAQRPDVAAAFDTVMAQASTEDASAVIAAYDFSGIGTLVDVGGGDGTLLAAILQTYPRMRGMLCDAAHAIDCARPRVEAAGVVDRCDIAETDFFETIPGGDAYLLKYVIHDWDDERAITILRNCRQAMRPQGRLLLVERVIPPVTSLDLTMLVLLTGRGRTEAEYRDLFAAAGFTLERIIPTQAGCSVIEGLAI